jgi:hypothetical protein
MNQVSWLCYPKTHPLSHNNFPYPESFIPLSFVNLPLQFLAEVSIQPHARHPGKFVAGIHPNLSVAFNSWIPAFAGMSTNRHLPIWLSSISRCIQVIAGATPGNTEYLVDTRVRLSVRYIHLTTRFDWKFLRWTFAFDRKPVRYKSEMLYETGIFLGPQDG